MADQPKPNELTDPFHLNFLGHGTDGTDGIDSGIHLRWAFNHKLGFPDCIHLYRRPSFPGNQYICDFQAFAFNKLNLPSTFEVPNGILNFEFHFESKQDVTSFPIVSKTFRLRTEDVVYIRDGELRISLNYSVSRIELGFLVTPRSNFEIIRGHSKATNYPLSVLGTHIGWKDIHFDAQGADGVTIAGKEIYLFHLAVWVCSDVEGNPWQEIKPCGCGLPLIPSTKPLLNEIEGIVPVLDVNKIDCRLAFAGGSPAPFNRDDILELTDQLLSIFHEGVTVPHGWIYFETGVTGDPEAGEESTTEVSIYEYLLAQSLHVPVAKVLDLYYVDRPQDPEMYFDYKIETMWPEWNVRQLDCEITFDAYEVGQRFDNLFTIDDLYFLDAGSPEIVEAPNELARTNLGLALSDTIAVTIFRFLQPVTEVQIWLLNNNPGSEVVVTAYQDYHVTYKDKRILDGESGMLRLHAEQIDSIRIEGSNVILSRVHYEIEDAPYFWQSALICGIRRGVQAYPLERPTGLSVSFMPGGPVNNPDRTYAEVPHLAGLRWNTNEDPDKKLMSYHPFAYHIERRLKNGPVELLTEDVPLLVAPDNDGDTNSRPSEGWPRKRQFYVDKLNGTDQYYYRIKALDIFGRESPYTSFRTFQVKMSPPPPPTGVFAHFLDYSAYDAVNHTSSDPKITAEDLDWLRDHGTSTIAVRWQWPEALAARAPGVDQFRIFLKEEWLNTYTATIEPGLSEATIPKADLGLTAEESSKYPLLDTYTDIPVWSFQATLNGDERFGSDDLRLSWMRQKNTGFLILSNTGGNQPTLQVLRYDAPDEPVPLEGQGMSLSIMADKAAYIDYALPENWEETDPLNHLEPRSPDSPVDGVESYTVYLTPPLFPGDPVSINDPIRYGQVGVCAIADGVSGGVSSPATIMAVYQEPPLPPVMPAYPELTTLKATPANVHGKSTFYLRWNKIGDEVQHFVYRSLDTTLFQVDNERRINGDTADYSRFETDADFDPADIDTIKQIVYKTDANEALAQYAGLTPGQLFILANLKENEAAYTRLHGRPIYEGDDAYQDRDTGIPDPLTGTTYAPDGNVLLYTDPTLNGRGTNRYFYKIKTVASNGLGSELGESTLPVECPRTTAPPAPVITAVNGGDRRITVQWAVQPGTEPAGYLLYRTQEQRLAKDWRRMELVKANETDTFTVAVNGNLPAEFEFTDHSAGPRQAYFYAVVAVCLGDEGKWLRSRPSRPVSGQGYDLTLPEPPQWDELNSGWVYVDEHDEIFEWDADLSPAVNPEPAIRLIWSDDQTVDSVLISRSDAQSSFGAVVLNWKNGEWLNDHQRFHLDRQVNPKGTYTYSGKSKSLAELISDLESIMVIETTG